MKVKRIHPGTRLLISFSFIFLVFLLPLTYQFIALVMMGIFSWRTDPLALKDPESIFINLWLSSGIFLILIHTLSYSNGFIFNRDGLVIAGRAFFKIGSLMVAFLWLIRTMKAEELYSLLIDLQIPLPIIFIFFKAIFLVPRFGEKGKEILIAQQARGFVLKGVKNRLRALILILSPLFSTMVYELEEGAASISSRGLYAKGPKTHITKIQFSFLDLMLIIFCISMVIITINLFF